MKTKIHPTAILGEKVRLEDNVEVGPYCVLDGDISIGEGTKIHAHNVLQGKVSIGKNNEIFPFCSIGAKPQDKTYNDEPTEVLIGHNNVIREYVSIHRGTTKQNKRTIIQNHCLLMAHVHLGHDVFIGDRCTIVNSVNLAGHVVLEELCYVGGGSNISQFVTLGKGAYVGGASAVDRDIPPFCCAYGNRVRMKGVNIVGLKRNGFPKKEISELVEFFRVMESSLLSPRSFIKNQEEQSSACENTLVKEMIEFINKSDIGIAPFMN